MSYQVFARKYRPRTFDDLLGQDHVKQTLKNAIEQKRLAQAYLFVGPRGTGKTTTARLIAKALNCSGGPKIDFDPDEEICKEIAEGRSIDVLEIDGASNNGVENVRDLNEKIQFAPVQGQFRIVYIDEVHMLSNAAFNALLKTLEEPPPHVKFLFATTEPHKILPTIISRCQRFDLRPISIPVIADHLARIASTEEVQLDEAAALAVAKGADGGMRDALTMLDQLVAFCGKKISEAEVLEVFGFTSRETVSKLCGAILDRNSPLALEIIQSESEAGRDLGQITAELIAALRELLVSKIDPSITADSMPSQARETLLAKIDKLPAERLLRLIDLFAESEGRLRNTGNKRLQVEIGVIKAIHSLGEARISDVIKVLGGAAERLPDPPAATSPAQVSQAHSPTNQEEPSAPISKATEAHTDPSPTAETASPPEAYQETRDPAPASTQADPEPPTKTPAPTPETQAKVSVEVNEALWHEVCQVVVEERPMIGQWLDMSAFLRCEGDKVVIALPETATFARESLLRSGVRDFIENHLRKRTGQLNQLAIELSADLVEPETPEPELIPEAAPEPQKTSQPEPEPESSSSSEPSDEDFYQDPLIQEALKIFEAEISADA